MTNRVGSALAYSAVALVFALAAQWFDSQNWYVLATIAGIIALKWVVFGVTALTIATRDLLSQRPGARSTDG